ncbi:BTAD domain-containing putative transcriptional regulator [Pedococcus bigeumensis]|nr:BTAD domain-containing putative transcriptional regulator [Pedococcus bigeumensis]
MSLSVQLLGRPRIVQASGTTYPFRSRKSWALLAYLILAEVPPSRGQLAQLLFADADDPQRALRWCLSEIRRGLGEGGSVEDDPVQLRLPHDAVVDVEVLARGASSDAIALPGLGATVLDGMTFRASAAYEIWLLAQQRHLTAASEAILHEAAVRSLARGEWQEAISYASRVAAMSPLDENHQALLIRLYRLAGDDDAAERAFAACASLFQSELGTPPGPAVLAARRTSRPNPLAEADDATIEAIIEAGTAAMGAGALEAGIRSLQTATRLADGARKTRLRVRSRLVLAEALVHALGGLDEEGLASLYEADEIAVAHQLTDAVAAARAELGYVDFLRARYDRALVWLNDALRLADGSPAMTAKATTYLGSVESDRANYGPARLLLEQAVHHARMAGDPRREAFAQSMLGRISLLSGDLGGASEKLSTSIALAQQDHWLSFLPWPQALLGEATLAAGDVGTAAEVFDQAFARACQLGDPCWEGIAARGLALVAEADGEVSRGFDLLAESRARANRLADPYVWLDGHILDAQCILGLRHGHPETGAWVEDLRQLASRTGMRELVVRSLLHGASLGQEGDGEAAVLLARDIDNPALTVLLDARRSSTTPSPQPPG